MMSRIPDTYHRRYGMILRSNCASKTSQMGYELPGESAIAMVSPVTPPWSI